MSLVVVSLHLIDDDNLNNLSPVLNFGLPRTFGPGIVKIPSTVPAGEVTSASHQLQYCRLRKFQLELLSFFYQQP